MANFSVYPNDIDGYATLPLRIDGVHEIRANDVNRLRDAIVKIESELGIQPSGVFGTVRSRLDAVGDAAAKIDAHIIDPTDAHDASSISILDTAENYTSSSVEGALGELAAVLPAGLDVIGQDNTSVANDGLPSFVGGSGTLFLYNTSGGANILKRTQPVTITGIHVIEIGTSNGTGTAQLAYTTATTSVQWQAPGDSLGTAVDISGLAVGDTEIIASSTTTKKIRITRTTDSLPGSNQAENFEVYKLDAASGTISVTGTGFVNTDYITRTATSDTGTSRLQFMVGGIVYPADRGTLVLQRKLRQSSGFIPIAALDLSANFTESNRATGQAVYTPTLADYDTITLYDRLPARKDYETLDLDSDGNSVYSNYDLSATYSPYQIAKYLIPASNSDLVSGELSAPTGISAAEMTSKVSVYRMVHYKEGITDFSGNPLSTNIYSISDALGAASDGDNTVRMSNVVVDSNAERPGIDQMSFRPIADIEVSEKIVSGIHYYNSPDDTFYLELRSDPNVFANAYLYNDMLRFTSDALEFPSGATFGSEVDVTELMDDGYNLFSSADADLPVFSDRALYMINSIYNTSRYPYPEPNKFSTNAHITGRLYDPFGPGEPFDAYGSSDSDAVMPRILINSYDRYRATETIEYFTDESLRVGTSESFDFNPSREQFTNTYSSNPDGYRLDAWDNTVILTAGDLQVGGRFDDDDYYVPGLIFPQSDYSGEIRPTQDGSSDYTAIAYSTTDSVYQRLFNLGYTINNGRLRIVSDGHYPVSFNDLYSGNASRPLKIEIKIPGTGTNSTGWLDMGKLFNNRYENGDGAIHGAISGSSGDITIPFTFGVRNNGDANGMVAVRVTYFSSQFATASLKILTMIQLLPPV